MSRFIPIHVQAAAAPAQPTAAAKAHEHTHGHAHGVDPSEPIPGPPPAFLFVGDTAIDEAAIAREMQFHRSASPHQARADAARALVVRELLLREVERLGLAVEAETVPGESQEEAAVRLLIEREVQTPEADDDACRRYFEQNASRLRHPDRLRLSHILLPAAPADSLQRQAASREGERLIGELREHPERFTEFAQRFSACPSNQQGGELGWIERGDTTPEFERQVFMLKPGMAGLTVETRYGHHVVRIDEIARGAPLDYAEAAPRIRAYLETQVRQNALSQYLHILAERHAVRGLEAFESA